VFLSGAVTFEIDLAGGKDLTDVATKTIVGEQRFWRESIRAKQRVWLDEGRFAPFGTYMATNNEKYYFNYRIN